jgi:DNA topoisomerase-1
VLWRKLPGAKSAGRVQSVCLRLIVEREMEIEAFKAQEYWTVKAVLAHPARAGIRGRAGHAWRQEADRSSTSPPPPRPNWRFRLSSRATFRSRVESKPATRNPWPPFMTSTLQQEASRKFGMGAKQCMNAAQRLYEAGHITYMRTDGIDMAPEAVMAARDEIKRRFGASTSPTARMYKNKAKNAQEAHECIRPTDMGLGPEKIRVEDDQRKLYDLIWKRTIASQMAAARLERTTVDVTSPDGQVGLRATGQVVLFDGYLKVYDQGRDDEGEDEDEGRLPQVMQGEAVDKGKVTPDQHFTQAPPRYTEATLVKRMEELGIGRPSTYASILTTIVDREYVRKDKNRLFPEDKGRLVTAFLANFFHRYVEYDFTADLEAELDDVSAGDRDYKDVLAGSGATFPPPSPRPPTCGSAKCWRRSTISWRRTSTRRAPMAATRASARPAAMGGCT